MLALATFLLARYGPSGGGDGAPWSFRGNGALIVPFGLGPAVLAGGWVALVLHYRGAADWLRVGLGAGLIGTLLALAGAAIVTLPGPARVTASQVLNLIILSWPIVALILAAALPVAHRRDRPKPLAHALAGVLLSVAAIAAFFLAAVLLPPGS